MAMKRQYGPLFALLSACFYASMGFVTKYIYLAGVSAYQAVFLRFFLSALILALMLAILRARPFIVWNRAIAAQALLNILNGLCFFYSLQYLPAGLMIVIFFTNPVFVVAFAFLFYRERPHWLQVGGLVVVMVGLLLVSGLVDPADLDVSPLGLTLAFASSIGFALYTIIGQKTLERAEPLPLLLTMFIVGTAVILAINPLACAGLWPLLTPRVLLLSLVLALFCTALAMLLFLFSIKLIGATVTSIISIAEVPLALIFAYFLLSEQMTFLQILGSVLIMLAAVLATWGGHKKALATAAVADAERNGED